MNRIDHILICEASISAIIVDIAHVHVSWGGDICSNMTQMYQVYCCQDCNSADIHPIGLKIQFRRLGWPNSQRIFVNGFRLHAVSQVILCIQLSEEIYGCGEMEI